MSCSGVDSLNLHNDCAYPVKVYSYENRNGDGCSKKGELLGTVPGNSSAEFTIGYRVKDNPCVAIKTENGKLLGWLNVNSPDVTRHGRMAGNVEFEATVRPPEMNTLTVSPLAAGLRSQNP